MTNVGRLFRVKAEAYIRETESELGQGVVKDFPQLQYIVGIIAGMRKAIDFIDEVEGNI